MLRSIARATRIVAAAVSIAAVQAPLAAPSASAGMIYQTVNRKALVAYLALPQGAGTHPGIIVIHEWWGLNDWVKEQADSLAALGYVALAVDLYRGKVANDDETAHQLMSGLAEDAAIATLRRGVNFLRNRDDVRGHAIGVIGWCMGGRYAIRLAAADPGIRACVMYYGAPITDPKSIKGIQAAVLGNFGAEDKGPSPDQVLEFEKALRAAGKTVDFKSYPGAGHAFANINNPWGGYRAEAAQDAWGRTKAFLDQYLKKASLPKRRR